MYRPKSMSVFWRKTRFSTASRSIAGKPFVPAGRVKSELIGQGLGLATVKIASFYVKGLILEKIFLVWGVIPKNDFELRSSGHCAEAIGPSQLRQNP